MDGSRTVKAALPWPPRAIAAAGARRPGRIAGSRTARNGVSPGPAAPADQLGAVRWFGDAGVAALKAVEAAALRPNHAAAFGRPVLDDREHRVGNPTAAPARERVEQFRVLVLGPRSRLLADEAHGKDAVNPTSVHPCAVARRALEAGATALIPVHNHPSGDATPSRADVEVTAGLRTAATAVFGIVVDGHLVDGRGRHIALRREGRV